MEEYWNPIVQFGLIIFTIIINFIAEIKQETKGVKEKRKLRNYTFILLIGILSLSCYNVFDQYRDAAKAKKEADGEIVKRNKEYNSSMAKANSTIIKLNQAFDTLKRVQETAYSLTDKMQSQLRLQEENTKILIGTNKNVDKLLDPLFPMDISITITIPIGKFPFNLAGDDKRKTDFESTLGNIKNYLEKNSSNFIYGAYQYVNASGKVNFLMFEDLDSVNFKNANHLKSPFISYYAFSVLYPPPYVIKGKIVNPSRQLYFNLNNYGLRSTENSCGRIKKSLIVSYSENKYILTTIFYNCTNLTSISESSSQKFSTTDLIQSCLQVESFGKGVELIDIGFYPLSGLNQNYVFEFNPKEASYNPIAEGMHGYSHIISKNDKTSQRRNMEFYLARYFFSGKITP